MLSTDPMGFRNVMVEVGRCNQRHQLVFTSVILVILTAVENRS